MNRRAWSAAPDSSLFRRLRDPGAPGQLGSAARKSPVTPSWPLVGVRLPPFWDRQCRAARSGLSRVLQIGCRLRAREVLMHWKVAHVRCTRGTDSSHRGSDAFVGEAVEVLA